MPEFDQIENLKFDEDSFLTVIRNQILLGALIAVWKRWIEVVRLPGTVIEGEKKGLKEKRRGISRGLQAPLHQPSRPGVKEGRFSGNNPRSSGREDQ